MCAMMQKLRVSSMAMKRHYAGARMAGQSAPVLRGCHAARWLLCNPAMSKLIISPSSANPITHDLTQELITIGRAPENLIYIEDSSVSSRHAQLNLVGETFHLQDLDSTNGTRVNGQNVTSVAL